MQSDSAETNRSARERDTASRAACSIACAPYRQPAAATTHQGPVARRTRMQQRSVQKPGVRYQAGSLEADDQREQCPFQDLPELRLENPARTTQLAIPVGSAVPVGMIKSAIADTCTVLADAQAHMRTWTTKYYIH